MASFRSPLTSSRSPQNLCLNQLSLRQNQGSYVTRILFTQRPLAFANIFNRLKLQLLRILSEIYGSYVVQVQRELKKDAACDKTLLEY